MRIDQFNLVHFGAGLVLGALTTSTFLGILAGLAIPIPTLGVAPMAVAIALVAALLDARHWGIELPQPKRQVEPGTIRTNRPWGALQFGYEMGTGVRTYITASSPYVLACCIVLLASRFGSSFMASTLAGVGFAAGRFLMPLLRGLSGDPLGWDSRLASHSRFFKTGTVVVVLATCVSLAFQASR